MWGRKTVALIIPASGKRSSLFEVITEFDSTGYIDEIVVVSNDVDPDLKKRLSQNKVKIIENREYGKGVAIKKGIRSTKADLLIIADDSGAFKGKDVLKLLAYSDDFDTVFGSRTHLPLIEKKSDMTFSRRVINDLLGKLVSLLFMSQPITDMGCFLRITNRKGWNKIEKSCTSKKEIFIVEWLLASIRHKVRFTEIPVNFRVPPNPSAYSGDFLLLAITGLVVFFYIWKTWLDYILTNVFLSEEKIKLKYTD